MTSEVKTEESSSRPHKVWSCDRQTKKAVVVSTLQELKEKGGNKLGYSNISELKVVLECDGTEIDDDNYFQMVDRDTVFLILQPAERWLPPGVEAIRAGCDTTDSLGLTAVSTSCLDITTILNALNSDIANLLILNDAQLQIIAELHPEQTQDLDVAPQVLEAIREACDRLLIDRRNASDVINLVNCLRGVSSDTVDSASFACESTRNQSELLSLVKKVRSWQKSHASKRSSTDAVTNKQNKIMKLTRKRRK